VSASSKPVRVLVAGLGNMGRSHALAYHNNPGFEIVGLVNRSKVPLPEELSGYTIHPDFKTALAELKPELCSICTYSDSHADFAVMAFEAGADVFVEKPLATTVADAERVVAAAKKHGRKLVIGYILRHHPSWIRLIAEARKLGLRLSDEIAPDMYNYGHLQVIFEDGSAGWYEAGWGPMISETAFFVKDVMSPKGSVSIVMDQNAKSDDIDMHTKTAVIRLHNAETGPDGRFLKADEDLKMDGEPGHQELCDREQAYVLKAIRQNIDLDRHMNDAVQSLRICLAADESVRTGRPVKL